MTSQLSPVTETDVSLALSPRFSPSTVSAVPPSSGPDNGSSYRSDTSIHHLENSLATSHQQLSNTTNGQYLHKSQLN